MARENSWKKCRRKLLFSLFELLFFINLYYLSLVPFATINYFVVGGSSLFKIIFLNTGKRISLFVSLFLILVLSSALVASLFLSNSTLNKLGQSNYFQNKIMQVLQEKLRQLRHSRYFIKQLLEKQFVYE